MANQQALKVFPRCRIAPVGGPRRKGKDQLPDSQTTVDEAESLLDIDLTGLPLDDLDEWLGTMLLIREFEDSLQPMTTTGQIPGDVHQASGQEAVAVGVIRALAPGDIVASPHRPHHHAMAKGLTARAVMAELWGRTTGCSSGRGGTMHLNDFSLGY